MGAKRVECVWIQNSFTVDFSRSIRIDRSPTSSSKRTVWNIVYLNSKQLSCQKSYNQQNCPVERIKCQVEKVYEKYVKNIPVKSWISYLLETKLWRKFTEMALDLSILSPPSTPPMHVLHHEKVSNFTNWRNYLSSNYKVHLPRNSVCALEFRKLRIFSRFE